MYSQFLDRFTIVLNGWGDPIRQQSTRANHSSANDRSQELAVPGLSAIRSRSLTVVQHHKQRTTPLPIDPRLFGRRITTPLARLQTFAQFGLFLLPSVNQIERPLNAADR